MPNHKVMQRSLLGRGAAYLYSRVPRTVAQLLEKVMVRSEGGQMTSLSLREVLLRTRKVSVGNYSYGSLLSPGQADAFTVVRHFVSIGPGVRRIGANHPLESLTLHPYYYNPALGMARRSQDVQRKECVIESDVWIGAGSIILPNCTRIGVGAVIGAGSVVTKDVPEFAVVAGNPARVLKYRLTKEQRESLRAIDYGSHTPQTLGEELARIEAAHPAQ